MDELPPVASLSVRGSEQRQSQYSMAVRRLMVVLVYFDFSGLTGPE
jgi:hypothetical protein